MPLPRDDLDDEEIREWDDYEHQEIFAEIFHYAPPETKNCLDRLFPDRAA